MLLLSGKVLLLSLLLVQLFASCQKEFSCEGCDDADEKIVNKPPVANAGTDETIAIAGIDITLDGSLSTDSDNNITSYLWTEISTPSTVIIANPNAVQTAVSNVGQGTYQFELKVTDALGLSSSDTVVIVVNNSNQARAVWTELYALPKEEFLFGSNHINFLIGIQENVFGVSKNGSFWYYDAATNGWFEKGKLPTLMVSSNFSVVFSINNIGYLIGNGTCRRYNVITDQWTTKNNAPVGTNHVDYSIPLVIANKAYLIGSNNNVVTLYDPSTDTYTEKTRFRGVEAATGFVINEEGYCIQKDGQLWKYDTVADSWQKRASLPPSIYHMSGFVLNGYGYVIGDLNRNAYSSQNSRMKVWRYDPSLNEWKQIEEDYPGEGVYEIRTVSLKGVVYAGLGYTREDKDAIDFWSFK